MPLALVDNAVGEVAGSATEDGFFAGIAGVDLARGAVGSATPAEIGEGGEDGAGGERVESVFRKTHVSLSSRSRTFPNVKRRVWEGGLPGKHVRRCKRLHVLII